MFCSKCGISVENTQVFCLSCGFQLSSQNSVNRISDVFDSDDVELLFAELKSIGQNIAIVKNIAVGYGVVLGVVIGMSVIFALTVGILSS